jgi:hypothetical protein
MSQKIKKGMCGGYLHFISFSVEIKVVFNISFKNAGVGIPHTEVYICKGVDGDA